MNVFLPLMPGIGIPQLVRRPRRQLLASFVGADAFWTSNGRSALLWVVRLASRPGREVVLLPGYICKSVTDALSAHGVRMRFYRIDGRLRPDVEHIKTLVDSRVCAIMIVHYFGFPQDTASVSAVCADASAWLVEDCAHALFSRTNGQPVGRAGDAAIFSLSKTLPAPDGGFLVVNRRSGPRRVPLPRLRDALPCGRWPARKLLRALARPAEPVIGRPPAGFWRGPQATGTSRSDHGSMPPVDEPASPLARRIALTTRQDIIRRRRQNYSVLARMLGDLPGCELVYPSLPKGTCPWVFPLLVRDRERLRRALTRKGIPAMRWPGPLPDGVANGDFPHCHRLAAELMYLPVHQDLTARHMKLIARAVKEAMGREAHGYVCA